MICSKCGRTCNSGEKFCIQCGNVINNSNNQNKPNYNNSTSGYNNQLYNQNKPNYNNVTPGYNNQTYNQNKPNYNNVTPGYNNQTYNQNKPNYNNVTPGYNNQTYNQNKPNYNNVTPGYNNQTYNQNKPNYNNVTPGYNNQTYNQNKPNYNNATPGYNNQTYNQNKPNYNNVTPGYNNKKKSNSGIYAVCAIIFVTMIIVISLIIKTGGNSVYFNETENDISYYEDSSSGSKKNKGTTVIDTERVISKNISSLAEAKKEIVNDSVSQKGTCPREIIEIENRIIKNYGITAVNLCEMDVDFAKEIEQLIGHVYKEFPNGKGYLTNFTLINAPMSEGYIACFQPLFAFVVPESSNYPIVSKTSIKLNTTYFLNLKYFVSSMKSNSKSGHFPPNSTRSSTVAHEFAHYLSFMTLLKKYDIDEVTFIEEYEEAKVRKLVEDFNVGKNTVEILQKAYKNYQSKYNDYKTSFDGFRASISSYAVAKDNEGEYIYDETIAEAYHDWYLNGNKAKPASKEIVAVLKDRLK